MTHSKFKIQNPKFSLPRYDRYKDSGVEWLGDVPVHWEVRSLRGILKERGETNEGTKTDFILSVMKDRGVIPYTEKGNVGNKMSEDITTYKIVCPGDLVINKMNAIIGSLGISEYHGALSKVYFVMQPRYDYLDNRFYGYLFQIRDFQKSLSKISYGIMELRESINFNEFKNLPLPLPPKPEQERIVAFLDQKTAEIDALIAKKQRQIDLLDEQKAILINRAVTRGLNPNAKLKPSGIEWIGDIPEHWAAPRLSHVATLNSGGTPDRATQRFWTNGTIPWIKTGEIRNNHITDSEERITEIAVKNSATKLSPPGTLLMAMYGQGVTRGRVALLEIEATYNQACLAISTGDPILQKHLFWFFQVGYRYLRDDGNETSQMNLNADSVGRMRVLIPPPAEQVKISQVCEEIIDLAATVRQSEDSHIQSLKTLRSTLIAHAVTGRIKV